MMALLHLGISGVELSRHRMAVHALPVFHGMGFCMGPWAVRIDPPSLSSYSGSYVLICAGNRLALV